MKKERSMKINSIIKGVMAASIGGIMALTANIALADYPDKDITFIVPYSPGGGSDQMARRLQPGLEKALGVNVRMVYKTGGGGAVGFSELHRSKPDGYTISNVVVPNVIITSKGEGIGYKPDDFAYIGMTEAAVGALMVPNDSPYKTLDQFVAAAKAKPGMITVAGVGSTGAHRWGGLAKILGIKTTYVPVSGGVGKMMPMLAGSHVDAGMTASNHATKHKSIVRALVLAGNNEVATLPGIPTEPKWSYVTTWGIMAPPGTPANIVKKLNAALRSAASDPSVSNALKKGGYTPILQTVDEANAFMDAQIEAFK
jgi:tripartite-type tricarboxylate transporter receptor subunit TctC